MHLAKKANTQKTQSFDLQFSSTYNQSPFFSGSSLSVYILIYKNISMHWGCAGILAKPFLEHTKWRIFFFLSKMENLSNSNSLRFHLENSTFLEEEWDVTQRKQLSFQIANFRNQNELNLDKWAFAPEIRLYNKKNLLIVNNAFIAIEKEDLSIIIWITLHYVFSSYDRT